MRGLLNQPPLAGRVVMGIDPAYRTGCKVAVVDATGKLLATKTIYPHQPQKRRDEALKTLTMLVQKPPGQPHHHWQRHGFTRDGAACG